MENQLVVCLLKCHEKPLPEFFGLQDALSSGSPACASGSEGEGKPGSVDGDDGDMDCVWTMFDN